MTLFLSLVLGHLYPRKPWLGPQLRKAIHEHSSSPSPPPLSEDLKNSPKGHLCTMIPSDLQFKPLSAHGYPCRHQGVTCLQTMKHTARAPWSGLRAGGNQCAPVFLPNDLTTVYTVHTSHIRILWLSLQTKKLHLSLCLTPLSFPLISYDNINTRVLLVIL